MINDLKDILGLIISLSTVLGIFTCIVDKLFKKKLKPIEDRIADNERHDLENQIAQWRYFVTTFASELRQGVPATRQRYEAVAVFANKYEEAVEKLGIKNHVFDCELDFIDKCYKELNNYPNNK